SQASATSAPQSVTVWNPNGTVQLLTAGSKFNAAGYGINDAGDVVGIEYLSPTAAYLWRLANVQYTATALPMPAGSNGAGAQSVNNSDQVVGWVNSPANASFLWLPSAAYGLPQGTNILSGITTNVSSYATQGPAINDAGIIRG